MTEQRYILIRDARVDDVDALTAFNAAMAYETEAKTLDPAVRNRHAFPQPGRAQTLARKQIVGDKRAREPGIALEEQPGLLEDALLAGDGQSKQDVGRR